MEEKDKQTNMGLGYLQAQEEEVCDTFCAFYELTRACTRAKTLTKPLAMLHFLGRSKGFRSRLSDCCSSLFSVLFSSLSIVLFCWLVPSADCVLPLTAPSCQLSSSAPFCWLSFWPLTDLPSLVHFRSHAHAVCVGFAPKQTKGSSDRHSHTPTLRMPSIVSQLLRWKCDSYSVSVLVSWCLFFE